MNLPSTGYSQSWHNKCRGMLPTRPFATASATKFGQVTVPWFHPLLFAQDAFGFFQWRLQLLRFGEQPPFVLRMIQGRKSLILANHFCSVAFESYVNEPIDLKLFQERPSSIFSSYVWLTTKDKPRRTKFAHLSQRQGGFENALQAIF